ncbi:MAG: hypothetical protein AB8B61_02100 [Cyclobacteriaceae bacterium]
MQKIKLIWDFRGQDSEQTAKHHEKHLLEFVEREQVKETVVGVDQLGELHFTAYVAVLSGDMVLVRDALIPHRGEEY